MTILEVLPQALYLMKGRVSELEDGCQREVGQTSDTYLLWECLFIFFKIEMRMVLGMFQIAVATGGPALHLVSSASQPH